MSIIGWKETTQKFPHSINWQTAFYLENSPDWSHRGQVYIAVQ